MDKVKLIIGLGNPDEKYEKTYHNAGCLLIDYLNKHQAANSKHQAIKSDVYMNESGKFIARTLKKAGLKPREILISHDDSDIELGKYKISFGRSSAGHKGVESVIKSLGTKNFWRLRIGVRKKATSSKYETVRKKAGEFVLKKINKKDWEILEKVFKEAAKKIVKRKNPA